MEEKQPIKVNLSTILLIIALIVIAVMGYFIYKFYNDKELATDKVEELNGQVSNLENTIDNLQAKLDNVSNIINSNLNDTSNNTTTTSNDSNSTNTLSEKEALSILEKEFKIAEKIWLDSASIFTANAENEIIDFEKTLLKYGTQNLVNETKKNLPWGISFDNNKYYLFECGGARGYIGLDNFENIKITTDSITAIIKTKQSTYSDTQNDWIPTADKSSEFKLVKTGNTWLIDKFNSSDLD